MLSEFDCDSNLVSFYSTAPSATIVFTTESVLAYTWEMSGKWARVWGFLWALGSQLNIDTFWNNLFIPGARLSLFALLNYSNWKSEKFEDVWESLLNYLSSDLKFASFMQKM